MNHPHPRQNRLRHGYALVSVLIFLAVTLSFAGVSQRHFAAYIRLERAGLQRESRDTGAAIAVAKGLQLLETGLPPTNPYDCEVDITTSTGVITYAVTFASDAGTNWTVSALPSTTLDDPMPPSFAD